MAKLGTGGKVTIYNNAGSTDVIVDVGGWFTDASVAGTAGAYTPLTPARILDTRDGTGGVPGPVPARHHRRRPGHRPGRRAGHRRRAR